MLAKIDTAEPDGDTADQASQDRRQVGALRSLRDLETLQFVYLPERIRRDTEEQTATATIRLIEQFNDKF